MTPNQIIDEIWKLPWYQVAIIAVMDDMILFLKMWPFWVALAAVVIIYALWPAGKS